MESRNASFFENVFPCKSQRESCSSKRTYETMNEDNQNKELEQEVEDKVEVELRRSKRARTETSYGPDVLIYLLESEPQTYEEVVNSFEGPQWQEAINSEIESILQNHTWELVDLPLSSKTLGSKWIFTRKHKSDGSIDKYKVMLVIKGYKK